MLEQAASKQMMPAHRKSLAMMFDFLFNRSRLNFRRPRIGAPAAHLLDTSPVPRTREPSGTISTMGSKRYRCPPALASCADESTQASPVETLSSLRPSEICLSVKGFHLSLQGDQQRFALAIHRLARGHLHPALADAVFLHIVPLLVVQADADVMLENGGDVMGAARIDRQAIGQRGAFLGRGGFGHGRILPSCPTSPLRGMCPRPGRC